MSLIWLIWPRFVRSSRSRSRSTFSADISLLRQPHGLEGFVPGLVELDPPYLAVIKRPHRNAVGGNGDPTSSAPPPHPPDGDDCIWGGVDKLSGVEAALLEVLKAALHERVTHRETVVGRSIRSVRVGVV